MRAVLPVLFMIVQSFHLHAQVHSSTFSRDGITHACSPVLFEMKEQCGHIQSLEAAEAVKTTQLIQITQAGFFPFWQKWWFYVLCSVAVSAFIFRVYIYRLKQMLQLQLMRNTISSNLHDDIGASLSNICMLNELARKNIADPEKAERYLQKAAEEIQYISESLSDIVWNINPRYDNLNQLMVRMQRYAADVLETKGISLQFNYPETLHLLSMGMDQRRDFYLIFKEAVNNLAKYSGAPAANIEIHFSGKEISISISDAGKGISPLQEFQGNGLLNMKQRAEKWGGSLHVATSPESGTCVRASMAIR